MHTTPRVNQRFDSTAEGGFESPRSTVSSASAGNWPSDAAARGDWAGSAVISVAWCLDECWGCPSFEVGGGETFNESIRAVKLGGHIALIGVLSGPAANELVLPRIFLKQVRTSGIAMANHQSQKAMVEYLENSKIRPVISDTFDLAELAEAFQHQIDNKHFGKISISME